MQTLVLPGFSPKNRVWADEIAAALLPQFPSTPAYWSHWGSGTDDLNDFDLPLESKKVIGLAGEEPVNIIAKSIATFLTVYLLKNNLVKVNKVILCGIPINALSDEQKSYYRVLKDYSPTQVEIIHNENDVVGSAAQIQDFINTINPVLKVITKPRADHSYPYSDDFINFLKS